MIWIQPLIICGSQNDKYQQAIERAIEQAGPNAHVLDIGTGTGLLAMMAARAGAQRVTAFEVNYYMSSIDHTELTIKCSVL